MALITITVVDPVGGNAYDIELPDDIKVQDFLPRLMREMDIHDSPTNWALNHIASSKILGPYETLNSAGVGFGEKLRFVPTKQAA